MAGEHFDGGNGTGGKDATAGEQRIHGKLQGRLDVVRGGRATRWESNFRL